MYSVSKKKVEVVLFVICSYFLYTINGDCPDNLEMQNKWQINKTCLPSVTVIVNLSIFSAHHFYFVLFILLKYFKGCKCKLNK